MMQMKTPYSYFFKILCLNIKFELTSLNHNEDFKLKPFCTGSLLFHNH